MVSFTIKIAGLPIGVTACYPSTEEFCREYLTGEAPVLSVTVTPEDLTAEQERSQAAGSGKRPSLMRSRSLRYLETLALYRKITEALLPRNIILFHSSAVALNGKAYLFTARSGTGKTTHTRLWLKNIPGSYVLNGDKPLLHFAEDGIFVCGTPWRGKENYGVNEILPLGAVCLLERNTINRIEPITVLDALPALLTQAHHPDMALSDSVALLSRLQRVPLFRLGCNMEDEAALVSYRAMCGEAKA